MLSNDFPATPRPRPPARARRSVSLQLKHSPPPPYAATSGDGLRHKIAPLETFLDSSNLASTREGALASIRSSFGIKDLGWIEEKSREELAELLTKADNIIRERENRKVEYYCSEHVVSD